MSIPKLIVAVSLSTVAAAAHAGFVSALPEPTTVTLVFVAMAAIGLALARRKRRVPVDA
jgi:hypothetical protein